MNKTAYTEYSEYASNRFNRNAMVITSGFCVGLWILNLLNIFIVDQRIFLYAVITNLIILVLVLVILAIIGLANPAGKYVLVTGMTVACCTIYIFLTYHVILVLIIPLLLSAIYRKKWMIWYTYFCTAAGIFIASVVAYKIGLCDANTVITTSTTTADFIRNFASVKPVETTPVLNLILFFAFPRCMCILSTVPILLHITKVIDKRTSDLLAIQEHNLELAREQQNTQRKVIISLSSIIESRDQVTGEHIHNTEIVVHFLIEKLKENNLFTDTLTEDYCQLLEAASPLHDVGKIMVPDSILCKPGKLTDEEYEVIKQHPIFGSNIMKDIVGDMGDSHYLDMAREIALYHHERYDGKGYPYGLTGEDIPLCARIMAIADVLDALLSKRHYKEAFSYEKTKGIMSEEVGKQFDPRILTLLLDNWEEFTKLRDQKE